MAIKKIIKIAKEIIKPKKQEKPLVLKKSDLVKETKTENTSGLTKETN
jgi:ribosome biogenesis GTPase A